MKISKFCNWIFHVHMSIESTYSGRELDNDCRFVKKKKKVINIKKAAIRKAD